MSCWFICIASLLTEHPFTHVMLLLLSTPPTQLFTAALRPTKRVGRISHRLVQFLDSPINFGTRDNNVDPDLPSFNYAPCWFEV